jgi:hypothetical protein
MSENKLFDDFELGVDYNTVAGILKLYASGLPLHEACKSFDKDLTYLKKFSKMKEFRRMLNESKLEYNKNKIPDLIDKAVTKTLKLLEKDELNIAIKYINVAEEGAEPIWHAQSKEVKTYRMPTALIQDLLKLIYPVDKNKEGGNEIEVIIE